MVKAVTRERAHQPARGGFRDALGCSLKRKDRVIRYIAMVSIRLLALSLVLSSPAYAEVAGSEGATLHRLTPAQIAAIGEAQAQRSDVAPMGVADEPVAIDDDAAQPKRKVHGEIGFGIGTGGYSEVFGTVVTPLGDNGVFAFTFAQQNGGHYNRYRRR